MNLLLSSGVTSGCGFYAVEPSKKEEGTELKMKITAEYDQPLKKHLDSVDPINAVGAGSAR